MKLNLMLAGLAFLALPATQALAHADVHVDFGFALPFPFVVERAPRYDYWSSPVYEPEYSPRRYYAPRDYAYRDWEGRDGDDRDWNRGHDDREWRREREWRGESQDRYDDDDED